MRVLDSKDALRESLVELRRGGAETIALVPTMGALHEGHLSLVRAARSAADTVAVSIFVNPTQFGHDEGFATYPRALKRDCELLAAEDVAIAFAPSAREMYGGGEADVTVDPGPLGAVFEGASRPGHFAGVCTVVAKLFGLFAPDVALFGEKDYQQLLVIRRMVRDLDFPVRVLAVPTVRDTDGLALSSRNTALSPAEHTAALAIPRALADAGAAAERGERDARAIADEMRSALACAPGVEPDYADVVNPDTLEPLTALAADARAIVAASVGDVRLIDNAPLAAVPAASTPGAPR